MRDDRISTIRQFFVWLASRMKDGDTLRTFEENGDIFYYWCDSYGIELARFSTTEGLYEY